MFQRKRKSGVYLHNYTRFKTVTKIIFILIISSVIAADSKCKLTSTKETAKCDQPSRLKDDDSDNDNGFEIHYSDKNIKNLPHSSKNHHNHNHNSNSNKLQLTEMTNSIYKYINDIINTRTSEILANSMNQFQLQQKQQKQRDFGTNAMIQKGSESDTINDMMNIEEIIDYLDTPDDNGRQLDSSEGRLFFFKGKLKNEKCVIVVSMVF